MKLYLNPAEKAFIYSLFDRLQGTMGLVAGRDMRVALKLVRNRMNPKVALTKVGRKHLQLLRLNLKMAHGVVKDEKKQKFLNNLLKKVGVNVDRSNTRKHKREG